MRCSSWATSCAAVDDWNSDRSLHVDNVRVAYWCLWAIGYGESRHIDRSAANKNPSSSTPTKNCSGAILSFTFLTQFLYCSSETGLPTEISFWGQLYSLFSFRFFFFFFFSMNLDANEFFPSNKTGTRSSTIAGENLLSTVLKTNHQIATARSIIHEWNTATTLSALTREWSSRHENRPTERNIFSLVLYNISSLRMHLEDLMEHISAFYPDIWALMDLHFNDDVNYQLTSHFKSRYTIYYQQGSNSFGGVCVAIAREVSQRIVFEFHDINNLIAADVFNSNKKIHSGCCLFSTIGRSLDWYSQSIASVQSKFNTDRWSERKTFQLAWCNQQLVWSSTCRVDRRKAEFENLQFGKANINSIASCHWSHHRAFSCPMRLSWNRSENARNRSLSGALPPIIVQIAQQHWVRSEKNWLSGAELHSQSQTEFLLHSLRTDEASIDRVHSRLRSIPCYFARKMYHLSHDQVYLLIWWIWSNRDAEFFVSIDQLDRKSIEILCFLWTSTFITNWERSSELNDKSFALDSSRKIRNAFGTIWGTFSRSERLELKGFWMRETIEWWPKLISWLNSIRHSILFGAFQRKRHVFSEPRSSRIQAASGREISRTSVETISDQHQWSASLYSSTEQENIEWSWEGVEQTAQIDSSLTLRLPSSNI